MNSLTIIGCGWLGTLVAVNFIKKSYKVFGTTTTKNRLPELQERGIIPMLIEIHQGTELSLPDTETVLIAFPPGRGKKRGKYPAKIRALANGLKGKSSQIIMCSSTSVYQGMYGSVQESDAKSNKNNENIVIAAEGELLTQIEDAVILRLGGLIGNERHPIKYLAGLKRIKNGDAPVNLVHGEDVSAAVEILVDNDVRKQVYNLVSPNHPSRKNYYTRVAEQMKLDAPEFEIGGSKCKLVTSTKFIDHFGHEFKNL
tara:strand:+ start:1754 stop:2521 length:768 start_codon:yes stop_codon:yes gene_type:complete